MLLCPVPLLAQSASNVLVVANERSPASLQVASRYAARRGVPDDQLVRITAPTSEQISRGEYATQIEAPIARWLASHGAQDRILYIVLTTGVPLRIAGTAGQAGTVASVDSELALLYRRMSGASVSIGGPVENPYFAAAAGTDFVPFSHASYDIYLVTRLDGFTVEDAMGLIDRGVAPSHDGTIVLAQRPTAHPTAADEWMAATADRLGKLGAEDRVVLWRTNSGAAPAAPALGYASWASNDPATAARKPPVAFAPGALATTFVSTDARTMTEPPAEWRPSPVGSSFAGSSQSLAADLVRAGVTGTAGQVSEPYLAGTVRPDRLFPAYVSGLNLAEAFYRAIPSLSWQTIVIGDPLCAPFRKQDVAASELAPPLNPQTELPEYFSARRLRLMQGTGDEPKLLLRADARLAKGDRKGAAAILEQAVASGTRSVGAWRALAQLREEAQQYTEASDAYQKVLEFAPDDVIALNNLAYLRAVRLHQPDAAVAMAERALKLSNGSPVVADTLAWIKHLSGNDADAVPLIDSARAALPGNANVQLHAAVVYAAVGRLQDAAQALKAAQAADSSIVTHEEYQAVARKVGG